MSIRLERHLDFTIQTGVNIDSAGRGIRVTGSVRLRARQDSIARLSYTWPAALMTGSLNKLHITTSVAVKNVFR